MKLSILKETNQEPEELKFYLEECANGIFLKAVDNNRNIFIPLQITEDGFIRLKTDIPLPDNGYKWVCMSDD